MYTILAKKTNLDNYASKYFVSYDNDIADSPDECLFFKTKKEAEDWTKSKESKEWKDCEFEIVNLEEFK